MENEHLKMKLKSSDEILKKLKEEEDVRNKKGEIFIKEYFKPSTILNNK
jgi:hypothetical protein